MPQDVSEIGVVMAFCANAIPGEEEEKVLLKRKLRSPSSDEA